MKRKKSKTERFKLFWASKPMGDGLGNALGYTTHEQNLRQYVSRIATLTPEARASLAIISPEQYVNPPEGYINFLFTMFEGTTLPDLYIENMSNADYLVSPSTWVKERFNQYFPPEKTIICPHGVDPVYRYFKRTFPRRGEPFVFLWVGAPNPRKGYEPVGMIWQKMGFVDNPRFQLYVKTTRLGRLERKSNVIYDSRKLTIHQLVNIYRRAHCFLAPHQGEGFHLCLAEAMRTGLPSIATHYSGVTDFFDKDVGYEIDYDMDEGTVTFPATGMKVTTEVARPNVETLLRHMVYVYENYEEAVKLGKKAHYKIAQNFTWPISAKKLIDGMRSKIE